MANQPQEQQNPQPQQKPQREDVNIDPPLDFKDEPPPVIKAEGANEQGEGDDVAANQNEENEGEGNKSADRNYRAGVKRHLKKGNVEQEAQQAKDALEDEDQRKDIEDAEEAARKGQIH